MRGLRDKVIIVTGGAGGIGAALCQRFAEEGAKVAVCDIRLDAARALVDEIVKDGRIACAYGPDITDEVAVKENRCAGRGGGWSRGRPRQQCRSQPSRSLR